MAPDEKLRSSCTRSLSLYAPQHRTPAAALARRAASSVEADTYGVGGVVQAVEDRVAALLGKPFYGRPHAEIADLFDTVYVSFYKGLGGIGGCALAGPEDDIEQARVWRTRHGGLMFSLWPYAADACTA